MKTLSFTSETPPSALSNNKINMNIEFCNRSEDVPALRPSSLRGFTPPVEFANVGEPTETLIAFANEVPIGKDGWAQIAPLGDFLGMALISDGKGGVRQEPAIQRVDKQGITQMVNDYNANRRGPVSRYLTAPAIYLGHPDVPALTSRYLDKTAKGVFANLACRDDGFYGEPILTEDGAKLISTHARLGLSGRWEADLIGEENGKKVFRPTRFISAGLSSKPNLPVQLVNESEQEAQTQTIMKNKILALCAKLKVTLANDATDQQIDAALAAVEQKALAAAAFANEKTTLESSLTAKDTEITQLKTQVTNATASFANERKARVGDLLDRAITDGRITAAERPDWERRILVDTQFANESAAIAKLTAQVNTKSVTLQRGDRKVEIANSTERREMVSTLVKEAMESDKLTYDQAYTQVQRKFPQLFAAMTQPEIKARKK